MKIKVELFDKSVVEFEVEYQGTAKEDTKSYKIYKITTGIVEHRSISDPNNPTKPYKFGWLNVYESGDVEASPNIGGIHIGSLVD